MTVTRINLHADVFLACLNHALSTEKEEIMGLLLGSWSGPPAQQQQQQAHGQQHEDDCSAAGNVTTILDSDDTCEATIRYLSMLTRSDKSKDRVEISPEQLSRAAEEAESLGKKMNEEVRIVGWYHSHPNITVFPSHVDLNTQNTYQMLDKRFCGLIFACFNRDAEKITNRAQMTAFQATTVDSRLTSADIPVSIVASDRIHSQPLGVITSMPQILFEEELSAFREAINQLQSAEFTSIDSKGQAVAADPTIPAHHSAVYSKALVNVLDKVSIPVLNMVQHRINYNKEKIKALESKKWELQMKLANASK